MTETGNYAAGQGLIQVIQSLSLPRSTKGELGMEKKRHPIWIALNVLSFRLGHFGGKF
jgi:hypothetical protein